MRCGRDTASHPKRRRRGAATTGPGHPPLIGCLAGPVARPGPSPTRLTANQILTGVQPQPYSTLNGATNINGEDFGQLTLLQHDASSIDPAAGIPNTVNYFKTSGTVRAEIFAATNPSSGEIAYQTQPTDSSFPSYYQRITTSGTLTLGLRSNKLAVLSGITSALDYAGNTYLALQVSGTDNSKLTDIIGIRYFNETYPQGILFDTYSAGGYQTTDFLSNAGSAGAMFQALKFRPLFCTTEPTIQATAPAHGPFRPTYCQSWRWFAPGQETRPSQSF